VTTYREILAHIYGLGRFGIKPGLERINLLLQALGNPQDSIKTIHVAGTNGKGSTAAFLCAILSGAGYRVGLFTSPHLVRFTERIRIGGTEIAEAEVVRLAERVMAVAPAATTFFELVTAMAFLHFATERVDLAIMETGMGGRFDATNGASGIMSLITPVSLDHCEYLGRTVAEIAHEKAGVIKPGRPVVTSARDCEALAVIGRQSSKLHSPLFCLGEHFAACWEADGLAYQGLRINLAGLKPGIGGRYQAANAACALAAAELLGGMGFPVPAAVMAEALGQASWPGRMEVIGEAPRILLDGAHNAAGGNALAEALEDVPHEKLILVAGVMADKDAEGILVPLFPLIDRAFAVSPPLPRAFPSDRLAVFCRARGVRCDDAGTVAEGLARAKKAAGASDLILVCGSLFAVGEARAVLFGEPFEPFRG
jgi:dihydrofolate synthase / folylpolyglutamate synthase